MQKQKTISLLIILSALGGYFLLKAKSTSSSQASIISHIVDPQTQSIAFFWKDSAQQNLRNFHGLQQHLARQNKKLIFAMNGGMFKKDLSPLGLYIENGQSLAPLNTVENAYGNFYLQPNGVFFMDTASQWHIATTKDFPNRSAVIWATQSGPMLVIDGSIHPKFGKTSKSVHIRNGVGILPNGHILFAISDEKVNLYDFAEFFRAKGCKNALYLDGFVSRMYLPSKGLNGMGGKFGVMIAETERE